MKNSLPFARFTSLLKAVEDLKIPHTLFHLHRAQYHYIVGHLCLAEAEHKKINAKDLYTCSTLGSQPTAHKRIRELISFGLIEIEVGDDKRERYLKLTSIGHEHLRSCTELMRFAFS